jgi:hypothetical protein
MQNSKTKTKPDKKLTNINTQPAAPPKRTTFTYIRKPTTFINKIFKHTNIKIAYHTNNTIQETLTPKAHNHNKFSATGVHQFTPPDCSKAYTGQPQRTSPDDVINTCTPSETTVFPQNLPNV